MTVHLTTVVGLDLIRAGQMLAIYQIAGSVSRPIWGWVADRYLTPIRTLGAHGVGMSVAAALSGQFGAELATGRDRRRGAARWLHGGWIHRRCLC